MSAVTIDFYPFARTDIPPLLGSMGIANTMATFVFANFLTRVAAAKYRRTASLAVVLSWLSMITVAVNYQLDIRLFGIEGVFVQVGLLTWLSAFGILSILIFRLSVTGVGGVRVLARTERKLNFARTYNVPDFGIPCVDDLISTAATSSIDVYYPLLLVYDNDCPGFFVGMKFAKAGIEAGDAVVYITFSRPWSIVVTQLEAFAGYDRAHHRNVFILDCFSRAICPNNIGDGRAMSSLLIPGTPQKFIIATLGPYRALVRFRKRAEQFMSLYLISLAWLILNLLRIICVGRSSLKN